VVFDGVVEQCGACYVGVGDSVAGDDPGGNPEQVVGIRFTLPPIPGVQSRCQRQCVVSPDAIGSREPSDLKKQSFAQAGLAVHRGNRVQWHPGQQSPFRRVQPGGCVGRHSRGVICHDRLRLTLVGQDWLLLARSNPRAFLDGNYTVRYRRVLRSRYPCLVHYKGGILKVHPKRPGDSGARETI
jgi:hypothetical protein